MVGEACQVLLTFHGRLISLHLISVHACLSEHSKFCLCEYRLHDFSGIRFWYVDLRLILFLFQYTIQMFTNCDDPSSLAFVQVQGLG